MAVEGIELFQLLESVLEELHQQEDVSENMMQVHLNGSSVCPPTREGEGEEHAAKKNIYRRFLVK